MTRPRDRRASWGVRRRRSAERSAATATLTGAIARITPSTPPACVRASRGSGGSQSTAAGRGRPAAVGASAGARSRSRTSCAVLFAGQRERWLCVESIYQAIYDPAVALTRPARRRRRRRRLRGLQRRGRLTAMRMIAERPREVEDRVAGRSLGGRSDHGPGQPLGDRNADRAQHPVRDPARRSLRRSRPPTLSAMGSRPPSRGLPAGMRRTLTWDQGKELALHQLITAATGARRVLLRRARAVAARQQREHERAAARLLPQGHRPQRAHRRGPRHGSPPRSTSGRARRSAGHGPSTSSPPLCSRPDPRG